MAHIAITLGQLDAVEIFENLNREVTTDPGRLPEILDTDGLVCFDHAHEHLAMGA